MSKIINIKYLFLFISIFIFISCSDDIIEIKLNDEKKGSLKNDEYDFYKLTLPEEIDKNGQVVFEVEPNTELDSINNIVSDPNLYISINNNYPTNINHAWSSNRFGDETITVNGEYVKPFQFFYIGIHCKEKCNYILKISLIKAITIKENKINSYTLESQSVMKFSFTTRKLFNELSVNIVGDFLNAFNAYLAKNGASSSNTLPAEPIFYNGYRFIIKNNDLSNSNINYDLVVDNRNQKQELNIWLKYDEDNISIKEAEIMYDTISENKANCYYYPINKINQNKDIILSTTLFNGIGFMYIEGFGSIYPGKIDKSFKNKDSSYTIIQNRAIHLTKENFKNYGKFNDNEETLLNFCFYAEKNTSLAIKLHLLENFKKIQTLNYIYPGIKIEDILPQKSLTKYKMINFNIENDLNIFLTQKKGNPKLYLYMTNPDKNKDLLDYENFQPYKNTELVLEGQEYFNGYHLYLTKQLNKCKANKITNKFSCYLNAIVECDSNEECIYDLFFDHTKLNVLMEEKQIYTNVISEKENDTYSISINDPSVKNIAIVLTQNTGRTVLKLDSFANNAGTIQINNEVNNNDFMPGIIKISHKTFNLDNLIGDINLKVEGLSYASYSIYYYTFNDEENEEYLDQDKISMILEKGEIIKDIFMDNHKFKVYMYDNSNNGNKTDLYISLIETDSINSELYVFKDLNDFSILNDRIYGYLWKGDYNDYIYIRKDDKKYLENDVLYIMIYKKTKTNKNVYSTFYLGVTDENTPFLLNEGIEFKQKFDRKHYLQKFFYYYINDNNDNQDLKISISLFQGRIIVKVKIDETLYTSEKISEDSHLILIKDTEIKELCKKKSKCPINIEISNDKDYSYYSSFLIAVKSSKNIPIYLKQGAVNKRTILSGEEQNYIISIIPDKTIQTKISAYFSRGQGELYARKLLRSELYNIDNFPDENNYEYMATYGTSRNNFYIIDIPYEEIANYNPCTILLTIRGNIPGYYSGTKIEYSISVSNYLNELETDKSYRLFISQGEISYFHFKVPSNKKRLYISMSNKEQDAFMFLNYDKYITSLSDYNWKNIGGYNEYLDLSIEDQFFAQKQMKDIEGDYYLAIQGLNDCFYDLYISTQDVKILAISKGIPASCSCEKKNELCYFRYENINEPSVTVLKDQQLIFYTEYTYGKGKIFGKLYPNGNMEEIINSLPTLRNYEFKGKDSNEFLFVNLNKKNTKYTLSSVIVVGIQCQEKSLFDLSTAILDQSTDLSRNDQKFIYLKINQDNIYYLSKSSGKINNLVYYIYQEEDFNFQIKGLFGKAEIHTFTNSSLVYNKYLDEEKNYYKNYHHISDFNINSNEEENKNYYGNVPKEYGHRNYFFVVVKPIEDCLININIHYDTEMAFIPLNKEIIANINRYNYYAYFDLLKDSEEVVITITSVENKKFKVYLKKNIIKSELDRDINSQITYSKPNEKNYDIKGESNSLTSAVSLKVKNWINIIKIKSVVRVLINIETDRYSYNEKFKIIVTPVINSINTIHPHPHNYYFSQMKKIFSEKTLFILNNKNIDDDLMIIEISICKGNFLYILIDSPPLDTETFTQLQKRKIDSTMYSSNGKKIIVVRNLKVKEYYLLVYGAKKPKINIDIKEKEENEVESSDIIEILFFYYTTNTKTYNYLVTQDSLNYESKEGNCIINFKLPELKNRDTFGREKYVDYMNYTFIVSENKVDFEYMESTCYLTKLIQKYEKNDTYNYLKTHYDKENNVFTVKGFMQGKTYYMNFLGKNDYTGEIITYKPIMIVTTYFKRNSQIFVIIFLIIIFIVFILCIFNIYRKYRVQKAQLDSFETTQDPDALNKKFGNLKNINLNIVKKDYNSLSEDNKEIN